MPNDILRAGFDGEHASAGPDTEVLEPVGLGQLASKLILGFVAARPAISFVGGCLLYGNPSRKGEPTHRYRYPHAYCTAVGMRAKRRFAESSGARRRAESYWLYGEPRARCVGRRVLKKSRVG
jgi:hypothetical protein